MTAQEAIERLTRMTTFCSGGRGNATIKGKKLPERDEEIRRLNFTALDMAISAIEKQIPKRPERKEMCSPNAFNGWYRWFCPDCGNPLGVVNRPNKFNYCEKCGQALRWDDAAGNDEDERGKTNTPEPF